MNYETNSKRNKLRSQKAIISKKAKKNPSNRYDMKAIGETGSIKYTYSELPSEPIKIENEIGPIKYLEIYENDKLIDKKDFSFPLQPPPIQEPDKRSEITAFENEILKEKIAFLESQNQKNIDNLKKDLGQSESELVKTLREKNAKIEAELETERAKRQEAIEKTIEADTKRKQLERDKTEDPKEKIDASQIQMMNMITEVLNHAHKEAEKTSTQVSTNLISSIEEKLNAQIEAREIIKRAEERAREIENESKLKALERENESKLKALEEQKAKEIKEIYVKMEELEKLRYEEVDPQTEKLVKYATEGLVFVRDTLKGFGTGENENEKLVTGIMNLVQAIKGNKTE